MDRFLSREELLKIGLANVAGDVSIDRSAIFVSPQGISIGAHTRVDAFSLISGEGVGVNIGRNVHVGAGVYIYGRGGVMISDFAGISARTMIYSASDDFSGAAMTGPTLPDKFTSVVVAGVKIGRHAIVGAGSIILPGVLIEDCAAIGALTLVKCNVAAFTIVAGSPARVVGARSHLLLDFERQYLQADQRIDNAEKKNATPKRTVELQKRPLRG
jgi:dTDP-4-amino-4,6-dideoxy-D-glucose acyltransferase